jgi:hypothetical protein
VESQTVGFGETGEVLGRGQPYEELNVGQVGIITDIGKLLAQIRQRGKSLPAAQEMVGG